MDQYVLTLIKIAYGLGGVALASGAGAAISKKGRSLHRTFGKVFFFAMTPTVLIVLYLSFVNNWQMLGLISSATLYMGFSGVRATKMKRPDKKSHHKPKLFDWILAAIFVLIYLYFFVNSILNQYYLAEVTMLVAVIFGSVIVFDLYLFTRTFVKVRHRMSWLYKHLGRMLMTYAMVMTILMALFFKGIPNLFWLAPAGGILIVIAAFSRYYQVKYEG